MTFDAPGPTSLVAEPSAPNNLLAHLEVNANVYLALRGTHLENRIEYDALARAQDERGFWRSYFYPSSPYGTVLVLDLLRDDARFVPAVGRALSFIAASQNVDGSWGEGGDPYETALAVSATAPYPAYAAATRRGVDSLLSSMAADGSWSSRACIWEFHADERDVWRAHDVHGTFVSARCATALRRAAGQLAPAP